MKRAQPTYRIACDSLVALGSVTADGRVHFAKNSDRPELEAQPLLQQARQQHAVGSRLRCTYIEIPQVAETCGLIGSRPCWCWGFEHGLNEHGVAIGNHTIFTRESPAGTGLIGMDLVRLGLERGHSAHEALDVITALLSTYGQGGSGFADKDWGYNNSFLIADRHGAFVLETSDRAWAWREVSDLAALSNHMTLGDDWSAVSDGFIERAIAQGWWQESETRRFDVAAAYRDTLLVPESISSGRFARTCGLLEQDRGRIDVAALRKALRDHYGSVAPSVDISQLRPEDISVCMHAEPVGTTTASLVAAIATDPQEPLVYRASLGSPCCSVFVPLRMDAEVPRAMTVGGVEPSDDSLWWTCKRLVQWVEQDWNERLGVVRRELDAIEAEAEAVLAAASDAAAAALVSATTVERLRAAIHDFCGA